jgi:hypothetical protein
MTALSAVGRQLLAPAFGYRSRLSALRLGYPTSRSRQTRPIPFAEKPEAETDCRKPAPGAESQQP